ncbi:MAG: hypothetical protein U0Y82_16280 [Thermoleophilia bacterium]
MRPDGTTYVSTWVGVAAATTDGRVVAVGPQGLVRWSEAVGRASSQPALDAGGRVWTVARDGVVQAADDRGLPVFRRRLAAGGPADWVAATGDGVTVHAGAMTVGLAARPQAGRRPAARLLVRPVVIRVGAHHLRCVAARRWTRHVPGRRRGTAGRALVRAPVDGVARLRVESVTGGTARRWERVRVLAGDNRILLHLGAKPASGPVSAGGAGAAGARAHADADARVPRGPLRPPRRRTARRKPCPGDRETHPRGVA